MRKEIKLMLILLVSYFISNFSINNIFLAQSPRINPFFVKKMISKVNNLWIKTTSFIAFKNLYDKNNNDLSNNYPNQSSISVSSSVPFSLNNAPKEILDSLNTTFTKVSQGVYAGEKNNIKVYRIKMDEIEYVEYTFNINGKKVKIKVPKGEPTPNQKVLEILYK